MPELILLKYFNFNNIKERFFLEICTTWKTREEGRKYDRHMEGIQEVG